uniref:Uncharacterized protein n=1 Tax=Biomphalaria glabrata TaxID=6526 RepID=A0A2C9KJE9_BIOGL
MEEQLLLALEILLKLGANLEDVDENGCTALTASVKNCLGVVVLKFLLEKGADVNRRNKNGWTALHIAVMTHQYNCVETLLKYGADVNVNCYLTADLGQDGQEQKSALSIVLNSWYPSEEAQRTALMMIDHGASAELVRRDIIIRLIAADNDGILVRKLMKSGISHIDIAIQSNVFSWPETPVSALAVSLILDSLDISRYLIENWFLAKSDIKILSRNKKIIDYLELHTSKPVSYLKELSRQPMRLELLCFIKVSSALGSDQGRRLRVHNSKLPAVVQNQLLFSKIEHKVLEQVSDDNLFLYSEMFLKKQLL